MDSHKKMRGWGGGGRVGFKVTLTLNLTKSEVEGGGESEPPDL